MLAMADKNLFHSYLLWSLILAYLGNVVYEKTAVPSHATAGQPIKLHKINRARFRLYFTENHTGAHTTIHLRFTLCYAPAGFVTVHGTQTSVPVKMCSSFV